MKPSKLDFKKVDWIFFAAIIIQVLIGILFIYSAEGGAKGNLVLKQLLWMGIGLVGFFIILSVDYRRWISWAPLFYLLTLSPLIYLLIFSGKTGKARMWLNIGKFNLQPSEFAKIAVVLMAAYFITRKRKKAIFVEYLLIGVIVGVPALLVALQPDMGTALAFIPVFLSGVFLSGIRTRSLVIIGIIFILLVPVVWYSVLKPYQKDRIVTFVYPERDSQGAGYHVIQSKIAIGSGGFFGKGIKSGTQSQLDFLPEEHTDFIFSILAEEAGFVGSSLVVLIYIFIIMKLNDTAGKAADGKGVFLVSGFSSILVFHVFINIGMALGLAPVTGIPLPLLSYGGSALVSNLAGFGLVLNVKARRFG